MLPPEVTVNTCKTVSWGANVTSLANSFVLAGEIIVTDPTAKGDMAKKKTLTLYIKTPEMYKYFYMINI